MVCYVMGNRICIDRERNLYATDRGRDNQYERLVRISPAGNNFFFALPQLILTTVHNH
jgi:hypothetical protein